MSLGAPTQLRSRFEGVSRVVRFNWPYYLMATGVVVVGLTFLSLVELSGGLRLFIATALCIPLFFSFTSLIVSFYIYDLSDLHEWEWLIPCLPEMPRTWASFNAGYDETEGALLKVFDGERGSAYDLYDPEVFAEASIQRARRFADSNTLESAKLDTLPFENCTVDATFLILAIHEIRDRRLRDTFFAELYRVTRMGGRVIIVEHLRNAWNFAAYAHGAFHFYPRKEWVDVSNHAGFELVCEVSKTPFVRVFVFEKQRPS